MRPARPALIGSLMLRLTLYAALAVLAGLALYVAWTLFDFFWSFSFSFG